MVYKYIHFDVFIFYFLLEGYKTIILGEQNYVSMFDEAILIGNTCLNVQVVKLNKARFLLK